MAGYPNLHPSGFVEFQDSCAGPSLYRGQPSRETAGVTLNDFLTKYNPSGSLTDYKFLSLIKNVKEFSKDWKKLDPNIQKEIVSLLKDSDNDLSQELKKTKEDFDNIKDELSDLKGAKTVTGKKQALNKLIEKFAQDTPITASDVRVDAFRITLVAILAVLIAFFIMKLSC